MAEPFSDRFPRLNFLGIAAAAAVWSYWLAVSAGRTTVSLVLLAFAMLMLAAWGVLFASAKKHDPDWELFAVWP